MLETNEARALSAQSDPALKPKFKNLQRLKIICWIILISAGLVQAWYTRHRIFSDGVPYLEIARYYLAGNWKAALNSYWSPLYSWILTFWMVILRPSGYWETALLHLTNFAAYLACLVGFEQFIAGLLKLQNRTVDGSGLSEWALRITGYCVFLISCLHWIDLGGIEPDMVGTAISVFLAAILLKIEAGDAKFSTYLWFGILLGLEYLARAAFAVFIPFYIAIAAILLYVRSGRLASLKPVVVSAAVAVVVALPFITALSVSKGRFTIGDAGKCNYGWEIDGAARLVHWQGEPGDIGRPIHPTHKLFDHPAAYTFASPVPGSYPPWYDPSYWYSGISPHVKLRRQLYVLYRSLKGALYLFLRSPVALPSFLLIFFVGWRRWLSRRGILAYWFLLLPSIAYIGIYALVYLDPRYVAGSFLVIWMCIAASISLSNPALRGRASQLFGIFSLLVAVVFLATHLLKPARYSLSDLFHLRESERSINAMIAQGMKDAGLQPGDRIAWIGEAIDAEWVRLDGAKIVAEVPVRYNRAEDVMFRSVYTDQAEIKAFWHSPPEVKARILDLFRNEGAKFVMVDRIPEDVDGTGWHRVVPKGTPHVPWSGAQIETFNGIAYMRLSSR
ncbi:MAG: hypothetical protein JO108_26850 [Acidobacteriaceae bacterium]|nr:hypothetical protein [Acidobacteriaceae bacterium]